MSSGISAAATSLRSICRLFGSDTRQVIWPAEPGWYWARRHLSGSSFEIVYVLAGADGRLRVTKVGEQETSPLEAWDWHYRVKLPAGHGRDQSR